MLRLPSLRLVALALGLATPSVVVACGDASSTEGSTTAAAGGHGTSTSTGGSHAGGAHTGGSHAGGSSAGGAHAGGASAGGSGGSSAGGAGGSGGTAAGGSGGASAGGAGGASTGGSGGAGGVADAGPDAACAMTEEDVGPLPGIHVPNCSFIEFQSNPPSSGEHYPTWAAFKAYAEPLPRGFWIHDLEHGAVVVAYNCPNGCASDVAALEAFFASRPVNPTCTPPVERRYVLTPDPKLDARFAVIAWGVALKGDCLDPAALEAFYAAHYAHAPEDECFDGVDVLAANGGLPPGCGEAPDGGVDAAADAP